MVSRSSSCGRSVQCAADGGYPSEAILRDAHRIADRLPPAKAKQVLRGLFGATCCSVLAKGDRKERLEHFLAGRQESRRAFLEGSGLFRDPEMAGGYLPGSWRLTTEPWGSDWRFVIHGVRRASGEFVAVRLSVKQFMHASASLRAIRKAGVAGEHIGLTAFEWRRIWHGFDYRDSDGRKRRSRGLRLLLIDQLTGVNR